MSDVLNATPNSTPHGSSPDIDPVETQEWLDSLQYVINSRGHERAKFLLTLLEARARQEGVDIPRLTNTPYINTIPADRQPAFPVAKANKNTDGIGGHISTFALLPPFTRSPSITFSGVVVNPATMAT